MGLKFHGRPSFVERNPRLRAEIKAKHVDPVRSPDSRKKTIGYFIDKIGIFSPFSSISGDPADAPGGLPPGNRIAGLDSTTKPRHGAGRLPHRLAWQAE